MSEWDPMEQKHLKRRKFDIYETMVNNGNAVWMRNMEDNRKKQKSIRSYRDIHNSIVDENLS